MIHRMPDVREQGLHLRMGELLGQGPPAPQEMTRLDGVVREGLTLRHEVVKKVFEGIESPIDGGRRQLRLVLGGNERLDIAPGHGCGDFVAHGKEQAQIPAIIFDCVRRIVAGRQIGTKSSNCRDVHPYLPCTACRWVTWAIAWSYWCFFV